MKQYSIKKQAMKKGGRQMLSEDVQNRIHFSSLNSTLENLCI